MSLDKAGIIILSIHYLHMFWHIHTFSNCNWETENEDVVDQKFRESLLVIMFEFAFLMLISSAWWMIYSRHTLPHILESIVNLLQMTQGWSSFKLAVHIGFVRHYVDYLRKQCDFEETTARIVFISFEILLFVMEFGAFYYLWKLEELREQLVEAVNHQLHRFGVAGA